MGKGQRASLCLLAWLFVAFMPTGASGNTAPERGWTATLLDPGERIVDLDLAATGPGAGVALYNVSRSPSRPAVKARIDAPSLAPVTQELDDAESFFPVVDGSLSGGAVAAWYREDKKEVRIAEMLPGDTQFGSAQGAYGVGGNYSYGRPLVKVNDRGDAIVVHLQGGWTDDQYVVARFRPAGGLFGAPEPVVGPADPDGVYPRDVALGPDGTAVVAAVVDGRTVVATRPSGGTFGEPEALGTALPEHSWQSPRVGIDAAGNVVAAWLEGAPINDTGPVKIAFRPTSGAFGPPIDTGLRATDLGRIDLGVSLVGEVLLIVEASTSNPNGGTHIEGIHAVAGNALTGRIGRSRALTGIWGSYPSFEMNARGDAIVVWDECCPMALRARRRAPLGGFGPTVEVQPPIELDGPRYGRWVLGADVDVFGNGLAGWIDSEPEPAETSLGWDGPLVDVEPPEVGPLEDLIPPVIDGPPAPPIDQPGLGNSSLPPPLPPVSTAALSGGGRTTDRSAPRVTLRLRTRLRGRRRPRVSVVVRSTERARVRVAGRAGKVPLGPADATVRPGRAYVLNLPLTRSRAARVARAGRPSRRLTLRLSAVAIDSAGNVGRAAISRRLR